MMIEIEIHHFILKKDRGVVYVTPLPPTLSLLEIFLVMFLPLLAVQSGHFLFSFIIFYL
jgi:hypothetical protein